MMPGRLAGKTALITGAGDGMGKAAALLFAREGAQVVVAEINQERGQAVEEEIRAAGGVACFIPTDIGKVESVDRCVEKALSVYGKIDILYNNAAAGGGAFAKSDAFNAPLWETDLADWDTLIRINLGGVFYMLKAVIPHMIEQQSGVILNAGSANAIQAVNNLDAYTAAKGGVVSLTRTLASRLGRYGIRVNCISPGGIHTRFLTNNKENEVSEFTTKFFRKIPLGRIGEPEEIANAALFLAGDESSYITGVILPVDGGWNAI